MSGNGKETTAQLVLSKSTDDGKTWRGYLTLDERSGVSYPDITEDMDGNIYIIYDYNRYTNKEILLAVVKESDILVGEIINDDSYVKQVINKALGDKNQYDQNMKSR